VSRGTVDSPDVLAWRIGAVAALVLAAALVVLDRVDHRPMYSQVLTLRAFARTPEEADRRRAQLERIVRTLPAAPGVAAHAKSPTADGAEIRIEVVVQSNDTRAFGGYRTWAESEAAHAHALFLPATVVRIYHVRDLLPIPIFLAMLLSVSTLQMGARRSEDSPTFTGGAIVVHLVALGLAAGAYALYAPDVTSRIPMALFALVILASEVLWAFQLPGMSDDRASKSLRRPQLTAIACFALLALVRFAQPPTA
jgi:hypothetical protein